MFLITGFVVAVVLTSFATAVVTTRRGFDAMPGGRGSAPRGTGRHSTSMAPTDEFATEGAPASGEAYDATGDPWTRATVITPRG